MSIKPSMWPGRQNRDGSSGSKCQHIYELKSAFPSPRPRAVGAEMTDPCISWRVRLWPSRLTSRCPPNAEIPWPCSQCSQNYVLPNVRPRPRAGGEFYKHSQETLGGRALLLSLSFYTQQTAKASGQKHSNKPERHAAQDDWSQSVEMQTEKDPWRIFF